MPHSKRLMKSVAKTLDQYKERFHKLARKLPPSVTIWKILFGVWCASLAWICSSVLLDWYVGIVGEWLNLTTSFIECQPLLNWLIVLFIIISGFHLTNILWKTRAKNLFAFFSAIIFLILVNHWPGYYVALITPITYLWIINLLTCCIIAIYLINISCYISWKTKCTEHRGIPIWQPKHVVDGRECLAKSMAKMIMESPMREQSFAVGIEAGWGEGKTTVLSQIEEAVVDNMIVVKFNPWSATSPKMLIGEFFEALYDALSPTNSSLGKALSSYSELLQGINELSEIPFLSSMLEKLKAPDKSTQSLRKKIEYDLQRLDKGVLVLIDDLDRLDADELFETLRLIRNTADFKNLAYVVTYDRRYIVKLLARKGIDDGEKYIEKIFTTSITLPSYEPYILPLVVQGLIKEKFGADETTYEALSYLISRKWGNHGRYILSDFIFNYRDALRLANQISQDLEILKGNAPTFMRDFNVRDWYCLELIKFRFPEEYKNLKQLPNKYLDVIQHNDVGRISLKDDVNEAPAALKGLLDLMFGKHLGERVPNTSIKYEAHFYNYFALRILSTEVKTSEFHTLIRDKARDLSFGLRELKERNPRVYKSMRNQFRSFDLRNENRETVLRYIRGLIEWSALTQDEYMLSVIHGLSLKSFPNSMSGEVREAFAIALTAQLPNIERLEFACKLIMSCSPKPTEPGKDPDENDISLIDADHAFQLSQTIFDTEMTLGTVNVDSLANPHSPLYVMLFNLVTTEFFEEYPEVEHYVLDYALNQIDFKIREKEQFKGTNLTAFKNAFAPEYVEESSEAAEYNEDSAREKLYRMFGRNENVRHIINNWFKGTDSQKSKVEKALRVSK